MQPLDQHLTTPENITKIPQNSTKKQITTTFWKTCKPHQHHLGIPDTHSSEHKYEIGTTRKDISRTRLENPSSDGCRKEKGKQHVLINLLCLSRKPQPLLCFTSSGLHNQFFHLHQLVSFTMTLNLHATSCNFLNPYILCTRT